MLSYQPHGLCTLRCNAGSLRCCSHEAGYDLSHFLAAITATHQYGIGCLDHDHVVQPNYADKAACCVSQRIAAVLQYDVTHACIAGRIFFGRLPHGVPGPKIAPTGGQADHPDIKITSGAALHDGIVHGVGRYCPELVGTRSDEPLVRCPRGPSLAGSGGDIGAKFLECGKPHRSLQHEDAAVPVVHAFGEVASCRLEVRLLDKIHHDSQAIGRPGTDVAIARFRPIGLDAQSHNGSGSRPPYRPPECLGKRFGIRDGLIRGRHYQNWIIPPLEGLQGGQR